MYAAGKAVFAAITRSKRRDKSCIILQMFVSWKGYSMIVYILWIPQDNCRLPSYVWCALRMILKSDLDNNQSGTKPNVQDCLAATSSSLFAQSHVKAPHGATSNVSAFFPKSKRIDHSAGWHYRIRTCVSPLVKRRNKSSTRVMERLRCLVLPKRSEMGKCIAQSRELPRSCQRVGACTRLCRRLHFPKCRHTQLW